MNTANLTARLALLARRDFPIAWHRDGRINCARCNAYVEVGDGHNPTEQMAKDGWRLMDNGDPCCLPCAAAAPLIQSSLALREIVGRPANEVAEAARREGLLPNDLIIPAGVV